MFQMAGGLALFLYGMHVMGEGLTRASGGKLESILESLTKSKMKAVLLGAGVTALHPLQSQCSAHLAQPVQALAQTVHQGEPQLRDHELEHHAGKTGLARPAL